MQLRSTALVQHARDSGFCPQHHEHGAVHPLLKCKNGLKVTWAHKLTSIDNNTENRARIMGDHSKAKGEKWLVDY